MEAVFGVLSYSLALVADAGHNQSNVLGLLLAWGVTILVRRVPTPRRTYGLRRSSILAALSNAVLLLVAVGAILTSTLLTLYAWFEPEQMMGVDATPPARETQDGSRQDEATMEILSPVSPPERELTRARF